MVDAERETAGVRVPTPAESANGSGKSVDVAVTMVDAIVATDDVIGATVDVLVAMVDALAAVVGAVGAVVDEMSQPGDVVVPTADLGARRAGDTCAGSGVSSAGRIVVCTTAGRPARHVGVLVTPARGPGRAVGVGGSHVDARSAGRDDAVAGIGAPLPSGDDGGDVVFAGDANDDEGDRASSAVVAIVFDADRLFSAPRA